MGNGFHLCPLQKDIQRLFRNKPELLARPRLPIARRAELLRHQSALTAEQVIGQMRTTPFPVAGATVMLDPSIVNISLTRMAAVIARIAPFFGGKQLLFWTDKDRYNDVFLGLKVFANNYLSDNCRAGNFLLHLELRFKPGRNDYLELSFLRARTKGLAGLSLAALYNIALDLGTNKINYYVNSTNYNGRRFYYHLDFGRNINPTKNTTLSGDCEVLVG
jgi:hypothetical protein